MNPERIEAMCGGKGHVLIKHMNVICRLSDLICAGIYAGLVFGLFGGGCFLWNHRNHLYKQ